jgi:hypothetical protein
MTPVSQWDASARPDAPRVRRSDRLVLGSFDGAAHVFQRQARTVILGSAVLMVPMMALNLLLSVVAFRALKKNVNEVFGLAADVLLRKIGGLGAAEGLGTRIDHPRAETLSHLFLGAARPAFVWGLTGTPVANRLEDVWSLVNIVYTLMLIGLCVAICYWAYSQVMFSI